MAQSHDGQKSIIGIYLPGEIIGFDGLTSGHYQYSILAIEIGHVCEISIDSVHSTIPSVHLQLLKHAVMQRITLNFTTQQQKFVPKKSD